MNCRELKDSLHDYLERSLHSGRRAAVDEHAAACQGCAELLRTAGELTCRELCEFLHEYVEGTLEPARRAVLDRHFKLCPGCLDFLQSYCRTIELATDACAADDEVPPEVPDALVRAILAARARERSGPT